MPYENLGLDNIFEEESEEIIYKELKKCTIVYVFASICRIVERK